MYGTEAADISLKTVQRRGNRRSIKKRKKKIDFFFGFLISFPTICVFLKSLTAIKAMHMHTFRCGNVYVVNIRANNALVFLSTNGSLERKCCGYVCFVNR